MDIGMEKSYRRHLSHEELFKEVHPDGCFFCGGDHLSEDCTSDKRKDMEERMKPEPCKECGKGVYIFRDYCGAYVCTRCGDHKGLSRCYCGWSASGGDGYTELQEMGETIEPEEDLS